MLHHGIIIAIHRTRGKSNASLTISAFNDNINNGNKNNEKKEAATDAG